MLLNLAQVTARERPFIRDLRPIDDDLLYDDGIRKERLLIQSDPDVLKV